MTTEGLEMLIAKSIAGPDRFEQHWQCIGISPMHRALIRRLAFAHLHKTFGPSHRLVWSTSQEWSASQVVWIDASRWATEQELLKTSFVASIRVLWCWNQPNWRDFLAVTPWMATGVVYNLNSLQTWIRRGLQSGRWQPSVGANLLPSGSFTTSPT